MGICPQNYKSETPWVQKIEVKFYSMFSLFEDQTTVQRQLYLLKAWSRGVNTFL